MKLQAFTAWAIVGPDGRVSLDELAEFTEPLEIYYAKPKLTDWAKKVGYRIARVRVTEIDEGEG